MTRDIGRHDDDPSTTSLHQLVDAFRLHERSVHRLCTRYLGDADAASDATQETFARATVVLRTRQPEALGSYLRGIARNVCRDEIARRVQRGRVAQALESERVLLRIVDPEAMAVEATLVNRVWRGLSVRDRMLLVHRFAGYSYGEIAQRLCISVKAVEVGLLRARARARRLMDDLAAVGAWLGRPWRRAGHRGRPVRMLRGAGRLAAWKLVAAVMVISGLWSAPTLWRMAGATPSPSNGPAMPVRAALSSIAADPLAGVRVSSLTLSPSYGGDRTIYASGHRLDCRSACGALVRSGDGGHSWTALPARGFDGDAVLLPPAYPADPVILGAGPAGLQRSDDGGRSFRTVVTVGGPAAVAPRSPSGDALVAVGAERIVLYRTGTGTTAPGPSLPDRLRADAISFTGDGAHLLIAVRSAAEGHASLLRCGLTDGCRPVLSSPDAGSLRMLRLPLGADDAVGVYSSAHLYSVSADGATVRSIHAFGPGELAAVAIAPGGPAGVRRVVAALHRAAAAPDQLGESTDLGRSFALAARSALPPGLTALAATPDGRVVVAGRPDGPRDDGLRCSRDGGTTWSTRC